MYVRECVCCDGGVHKTQSEVNAWRNVERANGGYKDFQKVKRKIFNFLIFSAWRGLECCVLLFCVLVEVDGAFRFDNSFRPHLLQLSFRWLFLRSSIKIRLGSIRLASLQKSRRWDRHLGGPENHSRVCYNKCRIILRQHHHHANSRQDIGPT